MTKYSTREREKGQSWRGNETTRYRATDRQTVKETYTCEKNIFEARDKN